MVWGREGHADVTLPILSVGPSTSVALVAAVGATVRCIGSNLQNREDISILGLCLTPSDTQIASAIVSHSVY